MQHSHDEAVADLWTAQFFHPLISLRGRTFCTTGPFLDFAKDAAKQPQKVAAAQAIASQNRFFHWHLDFPEVFGRGGFDVVLGNPPWERETHLQEQEFFGTRDEGIATSTEQGCTRTVDSESIEITVIRMRNERWRWNG